MTEDIVRLAVVVIAVAVVVPLVAMAVFMPFGMMGGAGTGWHDGTHMYGDMGTGGPWIAWVITVAVLVGVGYFVYRSVSIQDKDEAVQELRRAYARGDLSDEEFEKRKKKLVSDDAN